MANNFVHYGNRITLGSEGGSGITDIDQKKPYEDSDYGGLAVINGPVQLGYAPLANPPLGVLDVGPTVSTSGPTALSAVHIIHDKIGINITAPNNYIAGDLQVKPDSGDIHDSNLKDCTGQSCAFTGSTINVQGWKGFDIKHPNKEGHRLRHVCIEGPEAGVYVRGRLCKGNKIELPDYWKGLVDTESITVSLTAIGVGNQDLFVEKIEWGKTVIVKSGTGSNVDCYYVINAARIDGEPLIVEYEGDTPAQYPGNSEHFSISGYDYGRGVDKT